VLDVDLPSVLEEFELSLPLIGTHMTSRGDKLEILNRLRQLPDPQALAFFFHCPRRRVEEPLSDIDMHALAEVIRVLEDNREWLIRHNNAYPWHRPGLSSPYLSPYRKLPQSGGVQTSVHRH
jgi:hypothetical protein